ncbi:MAG: SDR family oxidoreductase [Terriglobia bacterium]
MDKILITGVSGLLGWNLAMRLRSSFQVVGTYLDHQVHIPSVETVAFDFANLPQIQRLCDAVKPKVIIHTAAISDPDYCELHHNEALAANTFATRELAKAASHLGARLIYTSTDLVFDGKRGHYSEADTPAPASYYGKTKYLGELEISNICGNYVVLRLSIFYGRSHGFKQSFFEKLEQQALRGDHAHLFVDQFRSPLYLADAVEAISRLANSKEQKGLFHLGGPERMSRFEFGERFCRICDFPQTLLVPEEIAKANLPAPRPMDCSLSSAKIQKVLELKLTTVDEALLQLRAKAGPRP